MTTHDDFDRAVAEWFATDAQAAVPDEPLEFVLGATRHSRPRPAWLAAIGSRWIDQSVAMDRRRRLLTEFDIRWSTAIVLLALVVALAAALIYVGSTFVRPSPVAESRLGRLAYSLDGDIYLADWDGANPVRIADGSSSDGYRFPRWSPDGRLLLFERWTAGGLDSSRNTVIVADVHGNILMSFPGFWSSWSPDSSRVATWGDDAFDVYRLDGSRERGIHNPAGWSVNGDQFIGWTPDSRALVVSLRRPASAVWALPVDAMPAFVLTNGYGLPGNRVFAPDGTRMAVFRGKSLDILDATGGHLKTLSGVGPDPTYMALPFGGGDYWSPDSDRLAFGDGSDLNVIDVDTGAVTTLVTTATSAAPLRWSPDGRMVLFVQPNLESSPFGPSPAEIWRVNSDGSEPRLVVAGTSDGDWQWLSLGQDGDEPDPGSTNHE